MMTTTCIWRAKKKERLLGFFSSFSRLDRSAWMPFALVWYQVPDYRMVGKAHSDGVDLVACTVIAIRTGSHEFASHKLYLVLASAPLDHILAATMWTFNVTRRRLLIHSAWTRQHGKSLASCTYPHTHRRWTGLFMAHCRRCFYFSHVSGRGFTD